MSIAQLVAIERSLMSLQIYCLDALKEHAASIEKKSGLYRWRNEIKHHGNALMAALEKECNLYYKVYTNCENKQEASEQFNHTDVIANAMAKAIQRVIVSPEPQKELQKFVAFLNAYVEGDITVIDK
mgnify:FL=1